MSDAQRQTVLKWLPWLLTLALSLIGNAVIVGRSAGRTETKIEALHETDLALKSEIMPMEKRLEVFYTRREANSLEALIKDTNAKVAVLYQIELAKK